MPRIGILLALVLSACSRGAFVCMSDAQCGPDGLCDPSGWCSFPDADCPSGQRFGEHSGDGLAGMCVAEVGESTGAVTTGSATTTSSSTSNATSDTTTALTTDSSTADTLPVDTSGSVTTDASTGEPDDSLILWYSFDDPDALLLDVSGHGRDAICSAQACPTAVAGMVGMAAHFDGSTQYAELAHEAGLETSDALSVTVWVSPEELVTGTWQAVVAKPIGVEDLNSWEIGFEGSSTGFVGCVTDGTPGACTETPWPKIMTWHHAALTWDGMTVSLYFDGELADSTPGTAIAFDDYPMLLGADIDFEEISRFFAGSLDEVRVYNRVLAEDEIAALAAE